MEPYDSSLVLPQTVLQPVGLPTQRTSSTGALDRPRTNGGRVCEGILDAIGQTPLVRLDRFLPGARFRLYAKAILASLL